MDNVANQNFFTRGPVSPAVSSLYDKSQVLFHKAATFNEVTGCPAQPRWHITVVAHRVAYLAGGWFLLAISPFEALVKGVGETAIRGLNALTRGRIVALNTAPGSRSLGSYFREAATLEKVAFFTFFLCIASVFNFRAVIRYIDHLQDDPEINSDTEAGDAPPPVGVDSGDNPEGPGGPPPVVPPMVPAAPSLPVGDELTLALPGSPDAPSPPPVANAWTIIPTSSRPTHPFAPRPARGEGFGNPSTSALGIESGSRGLVSVILPQQAVTRRSRRLSPSLSAAERLCVDPITARLNRLVVHFAAPNLPPLSVVDVASPEEMVLPSSGQLVLHSSEVEKQRLLGMAALDTFVRAIQAYEALRVFYAHQVARTDAHPPFPAVSDLDRLAEALEASDPPHRTGREVIASVVDELLPPPPPVAARSVLIIPTPPARDPLSSAPNPMGTEVGRVGRWLGGMIPFVGSGPKTLSLVTPTDPAFTRAATRMGAVQEALTQAITSKRLGSQAQRAAFDIFQTRSVGQLSVVTTFTTPRLMSTDLEADEPITRVAISEEEIRETLAANRGLSREKVISALISDKIKREIIPQFLPAIEAKRALAVSVVLAKADGVLSDDHNVAFYVDLTGRADDRRVEYFNPSNTHESDASSLKTVTQVEVQIGSRTERRAITLGDIREAVRVHVGAVEEFDVVGRQFQRDLWTCGYWVSRYVELRFFGIDPSSTPYSFVDFKSGVRGDNLVAGGSTKQRQAFAEGLIAGVRSPPPPPPPRAAAAGSSTSTSSDLDDVDLVGA